MVNFAHEILILDDSASAASVSSQAPSSLKITVCNTAEAALRHIGVDGKVQAYVSVEQIEHPYDIVLLDYRLNESDMQDYPMGGLTFHSLFKASFTKKKRGQCIVCCYSDKMAAEKPKAQYVFDLAERKLRGSDRLSGLHQNAIGGIRWGELVVERANSILSDAPSEVFFEIATACGQYPADVGDVNLAMLASYLSVNSCTLNQFLSRVGEFTEVEREWLLGWMARRSLCYSMFRAYKAIPKFTHMANKSGRQLDIPITAAVALDSLPSINGHCIPSDLATELVALQQRSLGITGQNDEEDQARCASAKKAFRLALKYSDRRREQGFSVSDLSDVADFVLEEPEQATAPSDVYVYVRKDVLKSLISGLESGMRDYEPVKSQNGRIVCKVKIDVHSQCVLFVLSQSHEFTSAGARAISGALGNGKQWGPFPEILKWGTVWAGCQNQTTFSLSPKLPLNLGREEAPLRQNELAIVFPYQTH